MMEKGKEYEGNEEEAKEEGENAEPPLVYRAAELPVPSDGRVDRRKFLMGTIAVVGAGALVNIVEGCGESDGTPDADSTDDPGVACGGCTCDAEGGSGGGTHYWHPT